MRKLSILLLLLGLYVSSSAQIYVVDALRFMQSEVVGTARTMGAAGAFSAVGGDPGAAYYNPATLGMMRGSQAFITPAMRIGTESFNYLTNNGKSTNVAFPFGYSGAVVSSTTIDGWRDFKSRKNYALTFGRVANFNQQRAFNGLNPNTSITYQYVDEFNAVGADQANAILNNPNINPYNEFSFEAVLAWLGYLANYDSSFGQFFSPVDAPVFQNGQYKTSGGIYEIGFTSSGTYMNERLYLGFGLAVPILNFSSTTTFTEDDYQDGNLSFDQMNLVTDYTTSGAGFNFKLGILYRPMSLFRVGAYIHSPSFFGLNESYQSRMTSRVNLPEAPQDAFANESPEQQFNYSFNTPWKFGVSTAFFIKKIAFISADYEMQDFGSGKYSFGQGFQSFNQVINDQMRQTYRFNHMIRLGAEAAYKKMRFRGGVIYQTSPLDKSIGVQKQGDQSKLTFTTGFGLSWKKFGLDFAYLVTRWDEFYQPYTVVFLDAPTATFSHINRTIAITATVKF